MTLNSVFATIRGKWAPQKTNLKGFSGFTLAEVLITLVIVGVIAAMTIPTLMNNTNKQEYVVGLKKAYSAMTQVTNKIIAEEGNPKCSIGGWACSNDDVYDMYKKYISIAKECSEDNSDCPNQPYLRRDGSADRNEYFFGTMKSLITNDGMRYAFLSVNENCEGSDSGMIGGACFWIRIDVNGDKKPNIIGRDAFQFVMKENGLTAAGCEPRDSNRTIQAICTHSVYQCACRVLTEGAMNY